MGGDDHQRWDSDVPLLEDHTDYGLPVPSLVRTAKLATIEAGAAEPLGRLGPARWTEVAEQQDRHLGQ